MSGNVSDITHMSIALHTVGGKEVKKKVKDDMLCMAVWPGSFKTVPPCFVKLSRASRQKLKSHLELGVQMLPTFDRQ